MSKRINKSFESGWYFKIIYLWFRWNFLVLNQTFKENFKNIDTEYIIEFLHSMSISPVEISNYIDNWKVHYLRKYTQKI